MRKTFLSLAMAAGLVSGAVYATAPTIESANQLKMNKLAAAVSSQEDDVIFYDYIDVNGELNGGVIHIDEENKAEILGDDAEPTLEPFNYETVVGGDNINNRINIVLLGDGYTVDQLEEYARHVTRIVNTFFNEEPFITYKPLFNMHRVDVISNDIGVDNDPSDGDERDTALNMGYSCGGASLCIDLGLAREAAANAPKADQIIALAHSSRYGGTGYSSNVSTVVGDSSYTSEIVKHEFGHAFGDLADEYYGRTGTYEGGELSRANNSIYQEDEMLSMQTKWYRWLDLEDVSTFEGADMYKYGIYRPTNNSKMRELERPWGEVNTEQLIISAYKVVDPIDASTVEGNYPQGVVFEITTVDIPTITVQWYLDGQAISGAGETTLDTAILGNLEGKHTVAVRVIDTTDKVRDESARDQYMTSERIWELTGADNVAPVITLIGDADMEVYQGATFRDPGATAADDIDGDVSENIQVTGSVNTAEAGVYTLTYNVSDVSGNAAEPVVRTVTVIADTVAPVITLNGEAVYELYLGDTYSERGATATDNIDGDISSKIVITGSVNTAEIGTYTLAYNVNDAAGNAAISVTRTVVVSEIPDCLEYTSALSVHESAGRAYSKTETTGWWWSQTTTTTWYANGTGENLGTNSSTVVTLYEKPLGYFGEGSCPEPDTTAPVITLSGANPQTVYQGSVYVDPGYTAQDNADGNITAQVVIAGEVDTAVIGTYTLTYNVTDSSGNQAAEVSRTVDVVEAPDCMDYDATLSSHEAANRAYSKTETTGWWWSQSKTTTWYAVGSDETLGTNSSTTVSLKEQPPGYFIQGKCPVGPVDPEITSINASVSGDSVTVSGTAADENDDMTGVTVTVDGETKECAAIAYSWSCQFTGLEVGDYTATAIVTDSRGAESEPATVGFTISEASAPVITDLNYSVSGKNLTATATVTDVDGDLDSVVIEYADGGTAGSCQANGSTYTCIVNDHQAGTFEFILAATDAEGNRGITYPFEVTFEEGGQCITAVNSDHVSNNRAELRYGLLVYAKGSNAYLGFSSATTSLEETSPGVWTVCQP